MNRKTAGLLATIIVFGTLLAQSSEQASAERWPWIIEVHNSAGYRAEQDGELTIVLTVVDVTGDPVGYVVITVEIKKGDTLKTIRDKIIAKINETGVLEAKEGYNSNQLKVKVKDDSKDNAIKFVRWKFWKLPDLWLSAYDP